MSAAPEQLSLVDPPVGRKLTVKERFTRFHDANPWVLERAAAIARRYKREGFRRIGIDLVLAEVRWEVARRTKSDDFKMNNSYRPYYARLVAAHYPELASLFELRKQKEEYTP